MEMEMEMEMVVVIEAYSMFSDRLANLVLKYSKLGSPEISFGLCIGG